MVKQSLVQLRGCNLDATSLRRQPYGVTPSNMPSSFNELFDHTTLFYDAVSTDSGAVLVCPKLLNLEALLSEFRFWIDEQLVFPKVLHYPRFDVVKLSGSFPQKLFIEHPLINQVIELSRPLSQAFAGLNTLVTVNQNNKLDWINDWIRYYKHHHGLQALLIFDNKSDIYSASELADCVSEAGLDSVLVVETPFRYGPVLLDRRQHLLFLQDSLLYLSRLRFLSDARAVLSVDVDELVRPRQHSVFDEAYKSPLGIIRFSGFWRYVRHNDMGIISHGDHHFLSDDSVATPPKIAFVPRRIPDSVGLDVHGLSTESRLLRKAFHALIASPRYSFWHCFDLSTGWKGPRAQTDQILTYDPIAFNAFTAAGLIRPGIRDLSARLGQDETDPLVRVVIPAKNRVELLMRAIKSVQLQQFVPLEIVVVDDCSDPPISSLIPLAAFDRIKVLRHVNPTNASFCRNAGSAGCKAPFLAFLDSDDQWSARHLYYALRRLGTQQALFVAPVRETSYRRSIIKDPCKFIFSGSGDLRTSSFVMPRHVFESIGGFDAGLNKHQDWDLAFRLSRKWPLLLGDVQTVALDHRAPGRMSSRVDLFASQRFLERHGPCLSPKQRQVFLSGVVRASLRQSNTQAWKACKNWLAQNGDCNQIRWIDQVALRIPVLAHWVLHWKR